MYATTLGEGIIMKVVSDSSCNMPLVHWLRCDGHWKEDYCFTHTSVQGRPWVDSLPTNIENWLLTGVNKEIPVSIVVIWLLRFSWQRRLTHLASRYLQYRRKDNQNRVMLWRDHYSFNRHTTCKWLTVFLLTLAPSTRMCSWDWIYIWE